MDGMSKIVALVLCMSGLAACTVTTQGAQTGDGGAPAVGVDGGGDGGAPTGSAGISCLQVLQCVADCASSDNACPDACAAKGTPEAQAQVSAFATCIQKEACTDAACAEAKCSPSLTACASASAPAPEGTPSTGAAPPPGNVPADLVGTWSRTNYGATDRIVLNADGTGSVFAGISSLAGGCVELNSTTEAGTAVVTADLITVYANDVTNVEKTCGAGGSATTKGPPVVVEVSFSRKDATTIVIVKASCAAKYPNDPTNARFYCGEELTKQ